MDMHMAVGGRRQPGADMLGSDGGPPLVRLGDASIASPFTYKGDSVKCSLNILRCGRATLSTVLMMYKIMGLNSVMSAFAMSVLTLDGVMLGLALQLIVHLSVLLGGWLLANTYRSKEFKK